MILPSLMRQQRKMLRPCVHEDQQRLQILRCELGAGVAQALESGGRVHRHALRPALPRLRAGAPTCSASRGSSKYAAPAPCSVLSSVAILQQPALGGSAGLWLPQRRRRGLSDRALRAGRPTVLVSQGASFRPRPHSQLCQLELRSCRQKASMRLPPPSNKSLDRGFAL